VYDWKIEIYRSGQSSAGLHTGPLERQRPERLCEMETAAEDGICAAMIYKRVVVERGGQRRDGYKDRRG